jgi:hypothetical protein
VDRCGESVSTVTGMGLIDVTLTPPTKTTASRPSRRTVMNGNRNRAHFPLRALLASRLVSILRPKAHQRRFNGAAC